MRRFLSLFTMLMLCGVLAFAQSRVVSGKVTDNSGKPVPFASVIVKGKGAGVQTDVNGEYLRIAELREQHGGDGAKQAVLDRLEAWIDGVAAEIGA